MTLKYTAVFVLAISGCLRGAPAPTVSATQSTTAATPPPPPAPVCPKPKIEVAFSPARDGRPACTDLIVAFIGSARTSVRLQAYGFTSEPVAQALVQANANKIDVQVILDRSNVEDQYSKLPMLLAGKVTALIDAKHAIAHDKVIIVDGKHVETGSFNYTAAAQKRNGENCVFVWDNGELASSYTNNWETHKAHATPAKR